MPPTDTTPLDPADDATENVAPTSSRDEISAHLRGQARMALRVLSIGLVVLACLVSLSATAHQTDRLTWSVPACDVTYAQAMERVRSYEDEERANVAWSTCTDRLRDRGVQVDGPHGDVANDDVLSMFPGVLKGTVAPQKDELTVADAPTWTAASTRPFRLTVLSWLTVLIGVAGLIGGLPKTRTLAAFATIAICLLML